MAGAGVGQRELASRARELRRRLGQQVLNLREETDVGQAALARCARIDRAHLLRIERGTTNASFDVLLAIAACLGSDLGVRLFPTSGPRIHDRFQAPMIESLLKRLGDGWRGQPEVPVRAARGVIDLVLRRPIEDLTVCCECHSELRRLELVLRRLGEKTDALRGQVEQGSTVSSLLLLRSTAMTRAVARTYESTLAAAFPTRSADALAALSGAQPWPGPAIVWARVEGGRGEILDGPPRGVRIGR